MIYPQTFASEVSKNIEAIGKYGCLAMCYLYCIGIRGSETEYIIRNAQLDEAQAGIKIARRNINSLRYADDTTLMAESEGEQKAS